MDSSAFEVKTNTLCPICDNHAFLPAKLDSAFKQLQNKGIAQFGGLYIDAILPALMIWVPNSILIQLTFSVIFRYVILWMPVAHHFQTFPQSQQLTLC